MITYDDFQFAAPPGTSHEWVMRALKCAQCEIHEGNSFQVYHPFSEEYLCARLSCVRHPETWLKSIYNEGRGLVLCGGGGEVQLLSDLAKVCDSFEEYVEDVILKHTSIVGRVFSSYRATSVIREEDLPWSLIGFLQLIKTIPEGPLSQIISLPIPGRQKNKMRVTKKQPDELPLRLYRRLMDSEGEFCDRYEYY